jgi:hypothetical protein
MIETRPLDSLKENPDNPRVIRDEKFKKLVRSLREFPKMLEARPIVIRQDGTALGGNMRLRAAREAGLDEVPVFVAEWSPEKEREFVIKDNLGYGEWDWDVLANEWDAEDLEAWGLDVWPEPGEMDGQPEPVDDRVVNHGILNARFGVPPFSVLDARKGYWGDRKSDWHLLIGDAGESREGTLGNNEMMRSINNGASLLDPVLAEIANKWFGLPGCSTFDPFAGDSVFGFVSDYMGNTFTGIELRQEQADLNNQRLANTRSRYICDDGQNVGRHLPAESQDLLFSCPPYYDLEVYSDLENDASNQGAYADFLKILKNAFTAAVGCLKPNRFAFIVVGDVRDEKGRYRGFPSDVINIFQNAGMPLYNEMILVTVAGTLPRRAAKYMRSRKVGKTHQNVLVFYKGDPGDIPTHFPEIEVETEEPDESTNAQL